MNRKQLVITILIAFFVGALGSILIGHYVLPYMSKFSGFSWLSKVVSNAPIVINHTEQVQLNEGVNLIDLIKQSGNFTVSIYDLNNNYLGNGVIVTSDGLILSPDSVIRAQTQVMIVLNDGRSFTGQVQPKDPKSVLVAVTIPAGNLSVAQFDPTDTLQPGQRVIYLGRGNVKFERLAATGLITQSLANQLANKQISSDVVIGADYFGGPIINLAGKVVGLTVDGSKNIISEDLQKALTKYLAK